MSGRPKTPKKHVGKLKVKDPIEVYCRIRPLDNENEAVCLKAVNDKTIALFSPDVSETTRMLREVHYSFKRVYDQSTTQERLFKEVCLPLVQDLLQGSNGLLFTYGITSSGKTYTMSGNGQDSGLLPRSLDVIFNSLKDVQAKKYVFKPDKLNGFDIQDNAEALSDQQKELGMYNRNKGKNKKELVGDWASRVPDTNVVEDILPDMNFAVFISYVEIYNNYIYDLLDDTPIDPKKKCLNSKMLRPDQFSNMYVFRVTEVEVKTVEEALDLFQKGLQRRRVSQTALNSESSRSHSVFTIRVVQAPLDTMGAEVIQDKEKMIISQLSLVDLAGSERLKNAGSRVRETSGINSSLMALRKCIEILRNSQTQGVNKMVPYRENKLTFLFKMFFEGEGKIRMIVCVNPRADYYDETIFVMNFAELTQEVTVARPTPVSTPTVGYRIGRGVNYRAAERKAKEQGVHVSEVLPPTVYSLGSDFPHLMLSSSDDDSSYASLAEYLATRVARRNTFIQDLNRRQEDFRKNLMGVDKENSQLKQEKAVLAMDLEARSQQVRSLENKLSTDEDMRDMLQRQLNEYKAQAQSASSELAYKEREISNKMREMERMEVKWQEKYASEKDRLKRIMGKRLAEKQAELERKMCLTGEKFRLLREILNDDDWEFFGDLNIPAPNIPSATTSESSAPVTRPKFRPTVEPSAETRHTRTMSATGRFIITTNESSKPVTRTKLRSTVDIRKPLAEIQCTGTMSATDFTHGSNNQNVQFSNQYRSNDEFKENKPLNPSQGTKSIAVANPRHRKSASTGDVWIEHKPIGNLELATVLQPATKKKKSVSKLEVNDVIKSEKYMLQHQEQDSAGEVETQLYKGDVIPSAGGGAQVIFNDIEKLRQVSPPSVYNFRKRRSGELPLREIEDRCAVSVECHGQPSKVLRRN